MTILRLAALARDDMLARPDARVCQGETRVAEAGMLVYTRYLMTGVQDASFIVAHSRTGHRRFGEWVRVTEQEGDRRDHRRGLGGGRRRDGRARERVDREGGDHRGCRRRRRGGR